MHKAGTVLSRGSLTYRAYTIPRVPLPECQYSTYRTRTDIYTYDGKNVAEYVRLGDGPVNVRDHDLVCVMPQVDVTPATGESQRRFMALWHQRFRNRKSFMLKSWFGLGKVRTKPPCPPSDLAPCIHAM